MERTRIILADDHVLLTDAIAKMLEVDFDIVGTFHDGTELVQSAAELNPDLIILDIGMPKMNGLVAGQRLKRIIPKAKLIYLTMSLERDLAAEAFRLGASGYVVKNSAATELVHAIHEVLSGRTYLSPFLTQDSFSSMRRAVTRKRSSRKLTLRQKEVLQLLVEGRSMKEVAFILKVTPRTIAFHKYTMMEQLSLRSSAELIQFAIRSSIVTAQ
jgi:DNA-binding NarL/FixJ family response regulator